MSMVLLAGCAGTAAQGTIDTVDTTVATTTVEATTLPTMPALDVNAFPGTLVNTDPYTEPEGDAERLAYRRDLVEAEMRRMMTMYWTPAEDITYNFTDSYSVTLKAGRIYRGMPYTHAFGSEYGFLTYATAQNEQGVYTIEGLTGTSLSGNGSVCRIGNNCSGAVMQAWSCVSPTVRFEMTSRMTEAYGCIKVGDYQCNEAMYAGSTQRILDANGQQTMFGCYALLQKGDALVCRREDGTGHTVMVVNAHVERNADNTIDGEMSYVIILEQVENNLQFERNYYDEKLGQTVYKACGVDTQWSFNEVYKRLYLPVTCKELVDPTPLPEETVKDSATEFSFKTLCSGTITSNYPMSHLTMTITDARGAVVQQATCYVTMKDRNQFRLTQFTSSIERPLLQGSFDPNELLPGQYHCRLSCTISTGRTFLLRDYDFTVE